MRLKLLELFIYTSRLLMTLSIALFPRITNLFSIGDKLPYKK